MRLKYKQIDNLPPLAWLADISIGCANIIHGSNVEVSESFFVEGAWDGEFRTGDFVESEWFCGTGGKICKDGITFSTPTHVTSGLFVSSISGGGVIVSNSLHFLCSYMGYQLDPQYLRYETDFNTILYGVNKYNSGIRILKGNVSVYYFRTICIDDEGNVSESLKKKVRPFEGFIDYRKRIGMAMHSLTQNASDSKRKVNYGLVTTVSKGYDAPCCAVIAKECGCDIAVTFAAKGKYVEDSGLEIAQKLGYSQIVERDAEEYLCRADLPEAEQIASGEIGSDLCFVAFDELFKNRLVFTGDRGDSVWARDNPICNDDFEFTDMLSHIGVCERHLWVGYISVPVPLFGASAWTSIQQIAQSDEMKPWSVGGYYDRPIPRRICEEAGLERESFGINKHGAGFTYRYDWGERAKSRMSPTAAASFTEYVLKNKQFHPRQLLMYFWSIKELYLRKMGIKVKTSMTMTEYSQIANATAVRYLFPWASKIIQERYKQALEGSV